VGYSPRTKPKLIYFSGIFFSIRPKKHLLDKHLLAQKGCKLFAAVYFFPSLTRKVVLKELSL